MLSLERIIGGEQMETLPMFKFRNTAGREMPIPDTAGLARRCRLSIIVLILEKCFWV